MKQKVNAIRKQATKTQFKGGRFWILILALEAYQCLLPLAELPSDRPARVVSGSAVSPVSGPHIRVPAIFNTLVEFLPVFLVRSTPNPYKSPSLTLSPGPL